jgi:hypothetical protein
MSQSEMNELKEFNALKELKKEQSAILQAALSL